MSKPKTSYEAKSAKRRAAMDDRRRANDRVAELSEGFTTKSNGRDGIVYYREQGRVLELPFEMDGTFGISLYVDGLASWVFPHQRPTTDSERTRIRGLLEDWARQQSVGVTFSSSDDLIRPWEDA